MTQTEVRMREPGERTMNGYTPFEFEVFQVEDRSFHVEGLFEFHVSGTDRDGLPSDYSETLVIELVKEWMTDDSDNMRTLGPREAVAWATANVESLMERHGDEMVDLAERSLED